MDALDILDIALTTLTYLAASFILFYVGKLVYQLFHRKIDIKNELVEKDNFAYALAHAGYFIGLIFALGGILMGESYGLIDDLIYIGTYGLLGIILLNLSIIINDKVILKRFSVHKEIIEDRNCGTGIVEAASAIATGMIIMGSIYGEGGGVWTALIYWVVGQVLLIITALVYEWITPYSIHEHIEKDNVAVGIGFAGAIIAIGNLIRHGLMHDFVDWLTTLEYVGIDALVGLLFLPIARILADRILLPGQKLTDEIVNQEHPNLGAATIEAFAYVGGSVLIMWAL